MRENMFNIRLLGAIEVESNGEMLTAFRSQKTLAILAFLISENRSVTRDYLAGLAWPETSQKQALGLLRRSLHSLSSQLPGCLDVNRRTVRWRADAPAAVDIHQLQSLVSSTNIDDLAAATNLYRAPYLEGIFLNDCPEFERWLHSEQERWHQRIARVLARLIEHHSQRLAYDEALVFAKRLLALEPWNEDVHRQTMMLLARTGQTEMAIAQFERCRAALEEELGVSPAAETDRQHARILALARVQLHPTPSPTTPFVGRRAESDQILALLLKRESRLVTLLGPGGIGKTRIAIQMAQNLRSRKIRHFLHGVAFIALGDVDSVETLVVALSTAVGLLLQQGDGPANQVIDFLHNKEALLVLDEFEHLVDTECLDFVVELLEHAPEVSLLVTSRSALKIPGEVLLPVTGLATPASGQPHETPGSQTPDNATLDSYAAVQLFLETARRDLSTYQPSDQEASAIVELCRSVQGMPLAIELAAAWSSVLTPSEIVAEMEAGVGNSLDFLGSDAGKRPLRHHSMRAVIDSSWRYLTAAEQAVLEGLSVFRGSFSRQAAQRVADATPSVLLGLTAKSFLRRSNAGRFDQHPLLRQYAAEALGRSAARQTATHERHCTFFLSILIEWAVEGRGPRQSEAWQSMVVESENMSAAWTWAIVHERLDLLLAAMDGLGMFYQRLGTFGIGEAAFRAITQIPLPVEKTNSGNSLQRWHLQIKGLIWRAIFVHNLGRTQAAAALLAEAETLSNRQPGRPASGSDGDEELLRTIGYMHLTFGEVLRSGERARAAQHYQQSATIYAELNDNWGLCQAYMGSSGIAREYGEYPEAKRVAQQSLKIAEQIGDTKGIADASSRLGLISMDLGELDAAKHYMLQKLQLYRELEDPLGVASALDTLGLLGLFTGTFEEARHQFEEGLTILESLGSQKSTASVHTWLGISLAVEGHYGRGHSRGVAALALAEAMADPYAVGHARMLLGYTSTGLGRLGEAREHLDTAITTFQQLEQPDELGQAYAYLAYVDLALDRGQSARECLVHSLRAATGTRTILPILLALPAIARLLIAQGDPEQAIELWTLVAQNPMIANSKMMDDLAGSHVREASDLLSPDAVTIARKRGAQRDLHATADEYLEILSPRI